MNLFSIDVESDAASPSIGSMISIGAVKISDLSCTYFTNMKPITNLYSKETLNFLHIDRKDQENYKDPKIAMISFYKWLTENSDGRPTMISDNPAFDWQWINYYFHLCIGRNPLGYSARRIGDIYAGLGIGNSQWKKLYRKTKHTHNPLDDAMGNAEAVLTLINKFKVKL